MRGLKWKLGQNSRNARVVRLDHVDAPRGGEHRGSTACSFRADAEPVLLHETESSLRAFGCRVRVDCLAEASWENSKPTNSLTTSPVPRRRGRIASVPLNERASLVPSDLNALFDVLAQGGLRSERETAAGSPSKVVAAADGRSVRFPSSAIRARTTSGRQLA